MSFKRPTNCVIDGCSAQADSLRRKIQEADAVLVGAGAGLSASAGLTYAGRRFEQGFGDFIARYGFTDMYAAGFYPYPTPEAYWAYWSRHIACNRYDQPPGRPYLDLLELLRGKDFFVLTTNVDHQFQLAGFDKSRLFYTQGDYGLFQCSKPCHAQTYDNERAVRRMVAEQKDLAVPSELLPRCPVCGAPMAMNLRVDASFVEDAGWHAACGRYEAFLSRHEGTRLLLLELGVGGNTPGIIKYPFWQLAARSPKAFYVTLNLGEALCPREIASRSLCIDGDIGKVLQAARTPSNP